MAAQQEAAGAAKLAGGADGKVETVKADAEMAKAEALAAKADAAEVKEVLEDESETGFIGRRIAKVKEKLSATMLGKFAAARGCW